MKITHTNDNRETGELPAGIVFWCPDFSAELTSEVGDRGTKIMWDGRNYMYHTLCPLCGKNHKSGLMRNGVIVNSVWGE